MLAAVLGFRVVDEAFLVALDIVAAASGYSFPTTSAVAVVVGAAADPLGMNAVSLWLSSSRRRAARTCGVRTRVTSEVKSAVAIRGAHYSGLKQLFVLCVVWGQTTTTRFGRGACAPRGQAERIDCCQPSCSITSGVWHITLPFILPQS